MNSAGLPLRYTIESSIIHDVEDIPAMARATVIFIDGQDRTCRVVTQFAVVSDGLFETAIDRAIERALFLASLGPPVDAPVSEPGTPAPVAAIPNATPAPVVEPAVASVPTPVAPPNAPTVTQMAQTRDTVSASAATLDELAKAIAKFGDDHSEHMLFATMTVRARITQFNDLSEDEAQLVLKRVKAVPVALWERLFQVAVTLDDTDPEGLDAAKQMSDDMKLDWQRWFAGLESVVAAEYADREARREQAGPDPWDSPATNVAEDVNY